jgi:hypothetical protein
MNSRIRNKSLSGTEGRFWPFRLLAFGLLALGFAGWLIADEQHAFPDLTPRVGDVHRDCRPGWSRG